MNLVDCSGDALIVTEAERVGRTGRIRIGAERDCQFEKSAWKGHDRASVVESRCFIHGNEVPCAWVNGPCPVITRTLCARVGV